MVSQADFTKCLPEVTRLCFLQIMDQIKSLLLPEELALHTVICSSPDALLMVQFAKQAGNPNMCVCGGG